MTPLTCGVRSRMLLASRWAHGSERTHFVERSPTDSAM
jgi:hypothetical protein